MASPSTSSGKSSGNLLDTIVSLCKRRGFVYPSGEIYGGTRSAWDYGPLGVELKENVKKQWWRSTVTTRDDVVGLDSSVILPTRTWEASGHLATFSDPLVECQSSPICSASCCSASRTDQADLSSRTSRDRMSSSAARIGAEIPAKVIDSRA